MNNKVRNIREETDLYEEILTHESLDQYEGLLNHYRNNKKDLKRTFKKKSFGLFFLSTIKARDISAQEVKIQLVHKLIVHHLQKPHKFEGQLLFLALHH